MPKQARVASPAPPPGHTAFTALPSPLLPRATRRGLRSEHHISPASRLSILFTMLPIVPLGLLLGLLDAVCGLHVPVHVTRKPPARSRLRGRASVAVSDLRDVEYTGNITLGGQTKNVLLDTGRYVASSRSPASFEKSGSRERSCGQRGLVGGRKHPGRERLGKERYDQLCHWIRKRCVPRRIH
jgi:hypothetical protein